MLRAQQAGAKPFDVGSSVAPEQRDAVAEAGWVLSEVRAAEGANEKQVEVERLGLQTSQGGRLRP